MLHIKLLSFIALLSFSFYAHAQRENVWAFGAKAGLDFNSGQPIPIQTSIDGFGEANASVCDNYGRLLFYTEGTVVWDRNGNIMPGGNNLLPVNGDMNYTPTGSTSQGALIMPVPGDNSRYYVFSITANEMPFPGRLYYSLVDMNLNNGLGAVVSGQNGILLDSNLTEKMTAVTGDRCNIWLLVHATIDNTFKAYSISASGINAAPQKSRAGSIYGPFYVGQMVLSPDGKRLLSCYHFIAGGGLELFDFDKSTGIVSNARVLDKREPYYGGAFSPDNSKIYASSYGSEAVFQFDLAASEPQSSKTRVGSSAYFSHLKLASEGNIYFISKDRGYLSAINSPNLAGLACQVVPNAVKSLPGTGAAFGLPNVVPVIVYDTAKPVSKSMQAPCWFNLSEQYALSVAPTGWDYQWNTGTSGPSLHVDSPGTYWVNYYNAPCRLHTDTFHVTFPNGVLPDISIQGSCKGDNNGKAWAGTYTGDTVTYHYVWTTPENDTLSTMDTLENAFSGNYILHISTANCDTTLPFFLPEEKYKVSFSADSIICLGQELVLKNTSDDHFEKFMWDFGDSNGDTLRDQVHTYLTASNYRATLIGIGEICNDTAFQTISVDPQFLTEFMQRPDSICVGETVSFLHEMNNPTISNLNWSFGDNSGANIMDREIGHAYEKAGIADVRLVAQFRACPESSFSHSVYVFDLPKVNLGSDTGICVNGSPVILKNRHARAEGIYHHLWNTGDTTETLKVARPGTYSLTLTNEPLGCRATETIIIKQNCWIDIPNAFSPNGDGINDYFFPRQLLTKEVTNFRMLVTDRWGQVLFETTGVEGRGWDGRFNGQTQPAGVYVYSIEAKIKDYMESYKGNVTLIR